MAITIDNIEYRAPLAPYAYYEPCPADWWKRGEIAEHQPNIKGETESVSSLESEFLKLSQKWKSETRGCSTVASMVMHPAYLEIISHGEKVIPYILKDLQTKPSHWFIALKTLAKNYSPVKPEDAGNIAKMTEAWIEWGKQKGYLH